MTTGEGKGWARGRTAASDPRVANNAAAHRGLTYARHIPPEQDRRHFNARGQLAMRTLALGWSPTMAYVVGLMATDGCLLARRKVLNFKSEDEQLVRTFLECLGRALSYRRVRGRTGNMHYVVQFRDAPFYDWLMSIGLMPRKSLILGPIDVPEQLLLDCARGLLDGDGSVLNYWYAGGGKARGKRYEGFATVFNSASQAHLEWLRAELKRAVGVNGALSAQRPTERGTVMWRLAYAIRESSVLLPLLYPSTAAPCLERKRLVWDDYARRHALRPTPRLIVETGATYRTAA